MELPRFHGIRGIGGFSRLGDPWGRWDSPAPLAIAAVVLSVLAYLTAKLRFGWWRPRRPRR